MRLDKLAKRDGVGKRAAVSVKMYYDKATRSNVAILDTNRACGDFSSYKNEYVPTNIAKQVELCFNNKQYLFLATRGLDTICTQTPGAPLPYCEHNQWSALPGLDRVKSFGITYQDIMKA
ncbi:hypothetical protein MFIFM68171_06673 [Madurella fahalii]|uniref:Uncharacterized protein n=1 Tax=Madurella fahalii TaxID=1157608 RepID=A0ABQ0GFE1_9PEZI